MKLKHYQEVQMAKNIEQKFGTDKKCLLILVVSYEKQDKKQASGFAAQIGVSAPS